MDIYGISFQKSSFVPLTSIRAAEKVEEKSFGISHVMQIIYTNDAGQEDTAYLQCKVKRQQVTFCSDGKGGARIHLDDPVTKVVLIDTTCRLF